MVKYRVSARVKFHAVGQGLFCTGVLGNFGRHERQNCFTWVYDCGTNSARRFLDQAIREFEQKVTIGNTRPVIDLLAVSHFDHDHISGLVMLLSRFHIRELVLPYVPLWQRLATVFMADAAYRSQLTQFLVNPVAFVAGLRDVSVERILFVRGGGETPELPDFDDGDEPDFPKPDENQDLPEGGRYRWPVTVHVTDEAPDDEGDVVNSNDSQKAARANIRVQYMQPGTAITVSRVWEFVPYNDSELAHIATSRFRSEVAKLRNKLLLAPNNLQRQDILDHLKEKYKAFGTSGFRQNLISLFMYAGPLVGVSSVPWGPIFVAKRIPSIESLHRVIYHPKMPAAVLYTGDGFLNTAQRLKKLQTYLGPVRNKNIVLLQVMHHGSRYNWFDGIAEKIKPAISVFSSDPRRKKSHPHSEVVKDFLRYGPVQVDTETSLFARIDFEWGR